MPLFHCRKPDDTFQLGRRIGLACSGGECIALDAPLGAGKTVLAKGIADGLSVRELVTSPTYTIISEYTGERRFVHVDLYRVASDEEYQNLAVEELLDNTTVAVIEWPDRAGGSLPSGTEQITIEILADGARTVAVPDPLLPDEEQK